MQYVLTVQCPDRKGIVHAVSGALLDVGGNIVENAQFEDVDSGIFCLRAVFEADAGIAEAARARLDQRLVGFEAQIVLRTVDVRPRVMIMVSKFDHCLADLLYRWRTDDLPIDIALIVSNHLDCEPLAKAHGIEFVHLPVSKETKAEQEAELLRLIESNDVSLVVLARYMQVLSNDLCERLRGRAINIHHSFLPGFKGARPYHQAYARGVKLVGATAHFVTGDLDEGPIIEQEVVRVTHAHSAETLTRLGQDVERVVLARAVKLWAENRIFAVGNKTVVFP
jgi:formyltetrahydrofolate deformylase